MKTHLSPFCLLAAGEAACAVDPVFSLTLGSFRRPRRRDASSPLAREVPTTTAARFQSTTCRVSIMLTGRGTLTIRLLALGRFDMQRFRALEARRRSALDIWQQQ